MPTIPLEAESSTDVEGSSLRRPLLSDIANDEDENDEEIVSQLLLTSERSSQRRRRWQRKCCRWPLWAASFALLAWMGLFASVWSSFSCDLVDVEYQAGGVQLSITAVGVWSYQREVVDNPNTNSDSDRDSNPTKKKECVTYGTKETIHHSDTEMKDFFPSNKTLQIYSIMAPTFYFAAVIAFLFWLLIFAMHPEVLTQSETVQYPAKGITATVAAAAILLVNAGIFHLLPLYSLLNHTDNDKSPICNPSYSHCHLGRGGQWAAFAIFSSLFCGLVLSIGAYHVGCRAGRIT